VPLAQAEFVVVDVETTGLDPRKDRLLAIGAVRVRHERLCLGEHYQVGLRHTGTGRRDTILIHGIGPAAQAAGVAPAVALGEFVRFIGDATLVAYHAPFDRAVLERALRQELGVRLRNPWLDLAMLAPALHPHAELDRSGLDIWLDRFGLREGVRHRAIDDALVTGELFLMLLRRARASGITTVEALRATARAQAQLSPGKGMGAP
jgi:DNA polymerase-3 subunit epsilon